MAKRKKGNPWDEVYDRVRLHRDPDAVYVPCPTDAELDATEAELGSRFPRSYRAFMKRFGPGDLMEWVLLDPLPQAGFSRDILSHTRWLQQFVADFPERYTTWFSQLVYFAFSSGGDWYGWDPTAATDPKQPEYRCYCFPYGDESHPVPAGESFSEFVAWVESDVRSWSDPKPDPGISFSPHRLRKKTKPLKRDVKRWLAFNNHAAHDLAHSIRDGHPEAFPVLADALEEAGCTNADLLDSCRTGDPDIDGVWVLRVLLGEG